MPFRETCAIDGGRGGDSGPKDLIATVGFHCHSGATLSIRRLPSFVKAKIWGPAKGLFCKWLETLAAAARTAAGVRAQGRGHCADDGKREGEGGFCAVLHAVHYTIFAAFRVGF